MKFASKLMITAAAAVAFAAPSAYAQENASSVNNVAPEAGQTVEQMLEDRVLGDPNAPVTIIEYASLTCGHCGNFHVNVLPAIQKNYIETGKAKLVLRDFPLNRAALDASMVTRCLPADKYYSFSGLLFKSQQNWAYSDQYITNLRQYSKLAGLNDDQFDACLQNKGLLDGILDNIRASQSEYNINSTPTFVITNGDDEEILTGVSNPATIGNVIDEMSAE